MKHNTQFTYCYKPSLLHTVRQCREEFFNKIKFMLGLLHFYRLQHKQIIRKVSKDTSQIIYKPHHTGCRHETEYRAILDNRFIFEIKNFKSIKTSKIIGGQKARPSSIGKLEIISQ